jgi:hypothetical protein
MFAAAHLILTTFVSVPMGRMPDLRNVFTRHGELTELVYLGILLFVRVNPHRYREYGKYPTFVMMPDVPMTFHRKEVYRDLFFLIFFNDLDESLCNNQQRDCYENG